MFQLCYVIWAILPQFLETFFGANWSISERCRLEKKTPITYVISEQKFKMQFTLAFLLAAIMFRLCDNVVVSRESSVVVALSFFSSESIFDVNLLLFAISMLSCRLVSFCSLALSCSNRLRLAFSSLSRVFSSDLMSSGIE